MNFSGTKCDCCGKIKGETNHWHQIGVQKYAEHGVWIELGFIGARTMPEESKYYEVHDLCGNDCLKEHLMRLLPQTRNPAPEAE